MNSPASLTLKLLVVVLLVVLGPYLVLAEDNFCGLPPPYFFYSLHAIPVDCGTSTFSDCAENLCTCRNMTYDNLGKCERVAGAQATDCVKAADCFARYVTCVNNAYVLTLDQLSDRDGQGFCENSSIVDGFRQEVIQYVAGDAGSFNETSIFRACQYMMCIESNTTECGAERFPSLEICGEPLTYQTVTPVPGSTPAPTNPDGSFNVPYKVFRLVMTFRADFSSMIATSAKQLELKKLIAEALFTKLRFKFTVTSAKYTSSSGQVTTFSRRYSSLSRHQMPLAENSLLVTSETKIPASDSASLAAVEKNTKNLQQDSSTGWLSSLSSACNCTIQTPSIDYTIFLVTPLSPDEVVCNTRCVAGVIAGALCGVIIITVAVLLITRHLSKKSSGMSGEPHVPEFHEQERNPMAQQFKV
jgi:hypothetical protein